MNPDDLVELQKFSHLHEAQVAVTALAASGIDALLKESFGGLRPETSIAGGGVAVLVPRAQLDEARRVLESGGEPFDEGDLVGDDLICASCGRPLNGAAVCPDCNAEDRQPVLDVNRTRAGIVKLKVFVVAAALLLMILPVIIRRLSEIPDSIMTAALYVLGGFVAVVFLITILKSASDQRL